MTFNPTLEHLIKHQKLYLSLLLLLLLLLPPFTRYFNHNPLLPGPPSYFHLNAAEHLTLSNFYQNPYHLLLSLNFLHSPFLYQLLPLLLAFLSFLLLFSLIKELRLTHLHQFFFLLFLIVSPSFLYTFTILNHHSFFIFLNLLGFYLLLHKKRYLPLLAYPVFVLIAFFDVFSSLLTLSLLFLYSYLKEDRRPKPFLFFIAFFTLLSLFLKSSLPYLPLKQLLLLGPYTPQNLLTDLFSDLGGLFGFSLFALILALIGLSLTWKKENTYLAYPYLLLFPILFFYQTSLLIYLNFLIAFFASSAFLHLFNKEWKLTPIKNLSLFLVLLGLLFSLLTNLDNLSYLPPNPALKESLLFLKNETSPDQLIFSPPQESYFIEYFSQRPAFLPYHDPNFKAKQKITNQIFQSTYIKETFPLLEQNNLSYFYLSPQTLKNLPTDQGLIFLFQNERFKKIYQRNHIEIWEFEKEE